MGLSKTAKASMKYTGDGKKTIDPFDTVEKKISELRKQREAGLAVNRFDFIDALIDEYDKQQESIERLQKRVLQLETKESEFASTLSETLQADLEPLPATTEMEDDGINLHEVNNSAFVPSQN